MTMKKYFLKFQEPYPQMQFSVISGHSLVGVLPLFRDAVNIFYSHRQQNLQLNVVHYPVKEVSTLYFSANGSMQFKIIEKN